jgi:hypothetical protein
MAGMRFSLSDLLLGVSFFSMVFAAVMGRQSLWGFIPIMAAIVCGVALAGRLRKRNWW